MSSEVTAEHITEEMASCISLCGDCHDACQETVGYCLTRAGDHARPQRIAALVDCAGLCHLTRDALLRGTELASEARALCAEACSRCAASCDELAGADPMMERCAESCRRCAMLCLRSEPPQRGVSPSPPRRRP